MQKFIVTSDCRLKFGNVNLHRELLERGEDCIGGGVYEFDYVNNRMLLSGKSYDYGRVKWSYVNTLLIPDTLRGMDILYEEIPLSHFTTIEYYSGL